MMYETIHGDQRAATLEDYLAALREKKLVVISLLLLGLLAGYLIGANRTDTFGATATVLVNPTPVGASRAGVLVEPNLDRETEIVASDPVAVRAVELLGSNEDPLPLRLDMETEFVPDSDVIKLSFVDEDRSRAAAVANAFATAYVERRNAEQTSFYSVREEVIAGSILELEEEVGVLSESIGLLDAQREEVLADDELLPEVRRAQLDSIAVQRTSLITEQNTSNAELRGLRSDLSELERGRDSESPAAAVLSEALEARFPRGFSSAVLTTVGALAGLVLGVATAFVLARLDRSANSEDEVSEAADSQVVGSIPDMGWNLGRRQAALAMLSEARSVRVHRVRESYRRLRTSVEFMQRTGDRKSFLITSSHPGEGKTVTSANLAVAMATSGQRVALINADMRRPAIERLFDIENPPNGLSAFLGGVTDDLELIKIEQVPNLFVVPAGPKPANPGELLGSERFERLVDDVEREVDVVIVDTPPVGATADAAAASAAVDAVLIVVDTKSTSLEELRTSRADLDRAGAKVAGAILNRDASRDAGLFARRNAYAYGKADE